ncbi:MAG TPA: GNAT family N-acetyltransferase [Candidatus Binataceae bacterium]|jgi:predicted GNAT family N-acyltransferase|nr:GNAT family N-acetyltransferase [Candidatus Binataceae bacterium]
MAPAAVEIVPVRNADQMALAYAIRRRVFIEEQGIDENLERDDDDLRAIHVLAVRGAQAVGCGRMVTSEAGAKIGRMAVLPKCRGRGIGRMVLDYLVSAARQHGVKLAYLHAQVPVEGFYLKRGFHPVGGVFEEAGIPHRKMELPL